MGRVVPMGQFRKLHIPFTPVRVEILEDDMLSLCFTKTHRPDVVCARSDLPVWFAAKLAYLEERVSVFEPSEHGARMSENVFYINTEA